MGEEVGGSLVDMYNTHALFEKGKNGQNYAGNSTVLYIILIECYSSSLVMMSFQLPKGA